MTDTENMPSMQTYTDAQATDEAVLLLTRKLRRLHPDVFSEIMGKLPELARQALDLADRRADVLRGVDKTAGIAREYVDAYLSCDDEDESGN